MIGRDGCISHVICVGAQFHHPLLHVFSISRIMQRIAIVMLHVSKAIVVSKQRPEEISANRGVSLDGLEKAREGFASSSIIPRILFGNKDLLSLLCLLCLPGEFSTIQ